MSDELPPQPRATPAPSQLPAPVNQANLVQACSPVASMTHEQKMAEAIKRGNLPPAIMAQLGDPKTLIASAVIAGGVLAGLAATGYGAVAEAIGAGLLVLGAAMSGVQIGQGVGALVDFFEMTRCDKAQSPDDLDKAGKRFADGVAAMGVGGLTLALSLLGARGKSVLGGKLPSENAVAEQTANELKSIIAKAPEAKTEIDAIAQSVADEVGGVVAKADIKSYESALRKVTNEYDGDASKIKDLARNTIVVSDRAAMERAVALLDPRPDVRLR